MSPLPRNLYLWHGSNAGSEGFSGLQQLAMNFISSCAVHQMLNHGTVWELTRFTICPQGSATICRAFRTLHNRQIPLRLQLMVLPCDWASSFICLTFISILFSFWAYTPLFSFPAWLWLWKLSLVGSQPLNVKKKRIPGLSAFFFLLWLVIWKCSIAARTGITGYSLSLWPGRITGIIGDPYGAVAGNTLMQLNTRRLN